MENLTEEQIRMQEIMALTWMPGWTYLIEDFESIIKNNEDFIHDVSNPDTPTHSLKSVYAAQVNCLRAMIEKPASMIVELTPTKQ